MNYQEVDQKYNDLIRRQREGAISPDQLQAELNELMVQDQSGRWWTKDRDTGAWLFYDGSVWNPGTPEGYRPTQPPSQLGVPSQTGPTGSYQPTQQSNAQVYQQPDVNVPQTTYQQSTPGYQQSNPQSYQQQPNQQVYQQTQAGGSLSQGAKIAFYVLSFFIPLAGWILFFVYRSKPLEDDRNFAKMAGIIGLVAFVLYIALR